MADSYRENRKNELRRRVVDTETLREREHKKHEERQGRRPRRFLVFLLIMITVMVIAAGGFYLAHRQFRDYSVNWTVDFTAQEGAIDSDYEEYYIYADGLLKVTRDGASYISSAGKTIWNQAYEMNHPYAAVNGEYCAIGDQGKTTIFIMNSSGTTGQAETTLPISKLSVSGTGVVYALMEDSASSHIAVFTREGAALDISIKSILSGDGYPVDISVSPDGTELIVSFVALEGGTIQNKIIFYNLDEIGQNAGNNRVVGGFTEDFAGHLTGRVHFSDNTYAQAFYDGGIAFFSTKVLTSPELVNNVAISETMRAIAYSNDYVGVVTLNSDDSVQEAYRLTVYKTNGQTVFSTAFSFNMSGFDIDGDKVFLYNDKSLRIYDMSGNIKFDDDLDIPVSKARGTAKLTTPLGMDVLVGSTSLVESVELK